MKIKIREIKKRRSLKKQKRKAKLLASCYEGYIFLDRISWDNFNESDDLIAQVEAFKAETGYYPKLVHIDQIYRTKDNRKWCKEREITNSDLYFHLQALLIDSWFGLNTTFQQAPTNFFRIEMQYSALIF